MAVVTVKRRKAVRTSPAQLQRDFAAKLAAELGPHNVKRLRDAGGAGFVLLDVRSSQGYQEGHVPGAVNIPFEQLPDRLHDRFGNACTSLRRSSPTSSV